MVFLQFAGYSLDALALRIVDAQATVLVVGGQGLGLDTICHYLCLQIPLYCNKVTMSKFISVPGTTTCSLPYSNHCLCRRDGVIFTTLL